MADRRGRARALGCMRADTYLRDRIVRRVDSLQTLFARNTDTDVRGLDHADVVRTVADRERHCADAILDELHDERLLERGHAAANDTLALHRKAQQKMLVLLVSQRLCKPKLESSVPHARTTT